MQSVRFKLVCKTLFALILSAATHAFAQPRPVTLVVPFAAGGSMDSLARLASSAISGQRGQSVIVENRPGGGGYQGAESVARSAPDGSTLLITVFEALHSEIFTKGLATVLTQALTPVAGLGEAPQVMVVPAAVPARTLKEFVSYIQANPGKFNVGVVSNTTSQLDMSLFLHRMSLNMVPIPFNGGGPVMPAMLRGDLQFYLGTYSVTKPFIDSGKLFAIALAGSDRFALAPDIPTTREQGVNFFAGVYCAVLGPSKLPTDLVAQINKTITSAMQLPGNRELLSKLGYAASSPASPEELQARLAKQHADLLEAANIAGVKPQ